MARDSSGHSGKKQWQEYGCICWRLSNIILMTQNQVKEHERLFNITLMTQNQVKEQLVVRKNMDVYVGDYPILYL